jgi:membrane protein DedA with SNARE-associated domain
MKEALMVMVSAWSIAFIVLFLVFATVDKPVAPDMADARVHVIFVLFVGAVTGAGWLWFRRQLKKRRQTEETQPN